MRQKIVNYNFFLLHNDPYYYRHLLLSLVLMRPGSPGSPGWCFSRIFSVAFEQDSEADSFPTSSPPQVLTTIFDWIEVRRVRRPFLLPQKLTWWAQVTSSSILQKCHFRLYLMHGHFLFVKGPVETKHYRSKVYIKTGFVRANRNIIRQLFVERTFFLTNLKI